MKLAKEIAKTVLSELTSKGFLSSCPEGTTSEIEAIIAAKLEPVRASSGLVLSESDEGANLLTIKSRTAIESILARLSEEE